MVFFRQQSNSSTAPHSVPFTSTQNINNQRYVADTESQDYQLAGVQSVSDQSRPMVHVGQTMWLHVGCYKALLLTSGACSQTIILLCGCIQSELHIFFVVFRHVIGKYVTNRFKLSFYSRHHFRSVWPILLLENDCFTNLWHSQKYFVHHDNSINHLLH